MKLWALARNTFREAVRDKVLLTLMVIAFLVTAAARLVPELAAGEGTKIVQDMGLKSMTLFCVLIAVLVGGRLVYREIEKRTIFVILAKPVARWQFVLGKYLGLMLVLVVSVVLMTGWFALFMVIFRVPMTPQMLLAVLLLVMELAVVTSIAVLFSTFVTPISSAVFTFAVYFTGNMSTSLLYWGTRDKPMALQLVARLFYYVLPNLANFDITSAVVHRLPIDYARVGLSIGYALVYVAAALLVATLVFRRRNF
jgi:ABC-type transport system involved in multi-copper enzyme maturation permease subunit